MQAGDLQKRPANPARGFRKNSINNEENTGCTHAKKKIKGPEPMTFSVQ
jgi:hypothetical protein